MTNRTNREQEQDRRNQAYELRLSGKTYRQIGMTLGVGHETARRWITQHLAEETLPLVDEIRKQEVDRMLRILDRLEARSEDGDDKAIALQIKVSERLCKMLGADMPTQVQVERTETTQVDLAIQDLISRQRAQNAMRLEAASHIRSSADTASRDIAHMLSADVASTDNVSDGVDDMSTDELSVERIVFDN